jgi:hypothetical protein
MVAVTVAAVVMAMLAQSLTVILAFSFLEEQSELLRCLAEVVEEVYVAQKLEEKIP